MVVARKTPVAPAPSSSRSSSSQPAPKPVKTKTPPTPVANSNGKSLAPTKRAKSSPKNKPKRTNSSYSYRLFLLLLSAFAIYTVTVCPTDFPRTSHVCHSLDLYKTHILDPYVVPPVETLLHHAEPYVAPLKPYVSSAVDFTRTHVTPSASALIDFTLAQYRAHIAPRLYWFFVDQYWNGIIKPIYYQGIHPHLEPHTRPYRVYYSRFIVPGAQKAANNVYATYVCLRPHAILYLSTAQRHAINAYGTARPHAITLYQRMRPHAVTVFEAAKAHVLNLTSKVGELRRAFVDPHVIRIWEKVSEIDVTSSNTASASSSTEASTAAPTPTQALEDEPTPSPSSSVVIEAVTITPEPESVTVESVAEPEPEQEAELEATAPPQAETPTPSPSSSSPPAPSSSIEADIPPPSAQVHASSVPSSEHEAASAASVVAASLHADASAVSEPEIDEEPQSAEEVDDFLKDIGFSEDDDEVIPEPVVEEAQEEEEQTEASPAYGEVPPSPEERQAITAEKRAKITARHERWQSDLDALVRAQTQNFRASLSESRLAAVAHLAQWGPNGKGVGAEVDAEATKLLKGLEGYLRGVEEKVKKAGGKQTKEQQDRDKEMWAKVLEKVEVRFAEKVRDVQREVHEWFVGIRERELQEIDSSADTVKQFADRAQADLGLDYAWLDDVTYYDWQKYHDLMRTSENFTAQVRRIQAQMDPVGSDELIDALNELEREVNELGEGFGVLVASVQRRAQGEDGVFGRGAVFAAEPETATDVKEEEPEVSILPIEPEEEEKVIPAVEDILVGRSKEEVEAKLADVPVESVHAGREEL